MITYLLLRNNKESGPYSLNELIQFGLKPYDLVWINGKSAAWRYPGEIEELKEYAPMVEEQPYDRFFKKPGEVNNEQSKVNAAFQPKAEVASPDPQPAFTPKKSVFVTMPGQKNYQPQSPAPEPVEKKEIPVAAAQTISITENPVAAEIKYSQPLDDIKEMYVKTLQQRKQRIANKAFLIQSFKKAAVVLVIVGAGVLIGFTLKSNGGKKQVLADSNIIAPQQPATTSIAPETETVPAPLPGQNISAGENREVPSASLSNERVEKEPLFTTPEKNTEQKALATRQEPVKPAKDIVIPRKEIPVDEPSPGVAVDARTGERSRKMRSAEEESFTDAITESSKQPITTEPRAVMKSAGGLSKLVSVKSNDYHVVAFGGIRNLQLTVYNDSKYVLDNVTVEVQYLKPSEQPLRTENVQFRSVSPGGSMTIRLPDTNRGIKVLYKITNILSTQSAKETAGL